MMLNPVIGRNQPRNTWCVSASLELDGDGGFDMLIRPVEHPRCQCSAGSPAPAEGTRGGPGHRGHPGPLPKPACPSLLCLLG